MCNQTLKLDKTQKEKYFLISGVYYLPINVMGDKLRPQ